MKRLLLTVMLLSWASTAQAEPAPQTAAPLETVAKEAILIDMATGSVLFAKNPDERMAPSSMCKIMTTYLVSEALKSGKLHLDDMLTVSEHAWRQEGSRMFVKVGDRVKVQDLLRGVIIQSGNDAAVVLAEALGGSESNFATMMNDKAAALGMAHSHFMNATGLPDPNHYSTARDLAKLAAATMHDFPDDYHYYSEIDFTYNGIKQGNRNPLLYRNIGVDGLKTGHTDAGGFGLIASSVRDGRRMLMVVNGLNSMQERADEPTKILDWGYREFGLYPLFKQGQKLADAKVWLGTETTVPLLAGQNVTLSLPREARAGLHVALDYSQPVQAPVTEGQMVGKIIVSAPGVSNFEVPLVAGAAVPQVGFFARFTAKLGLLFGKA